MPLLLLPLMFFAVSARIRALAAAANFAVIDVISATTTTTVMAMAVAGAAAGMAAVTAFAATATTTSAEAAVARLRGGLTSTLLLNVLLSDTPYSSVAVLGGLASADGESTSF